MLATSGSHDPADCSRTPAPADFPASPLPDAHTPTPPHPTLSIIAAHAYPQDDITRFLRALGPQSVGIEVTLVAGVPIAERIPDLPWLVRIEQPGASVPVLRGIGLRAARAGHIAFVDPSCRIAPEWVAIALRALDAAPAVTGPVRYDGGRSLATFAAFLAEYGTFLPPADTGVAGSNFAVCRAALERVHAFADSFDKPAVVERLIAAGLGPRLVPDLVVAHRRPWLPGPFLADRFALGREYARQRPAGPIVRIGRALAASLVGPLLFARLARSLWPKGRSRSAFLRAAPLTLAFLTAWALGEASGYLSRRC